MRSAILLLLLCLCLSPCVAGASGKQKHLSDVTDRDEFQKLCRKKAFLFNEETRVYSLFHLEELKKLSLEWEKMKGHRMSLQRYLAEHDEGFKDLAMRWKHSYDDETVSGLLLYTDHKGMLIHAFARGMPLLTPDDEVIADFTAHRDEFEELRAMLAADYGKGLKTVRLEKTEPESLSETGITPERLEQYREKMRSLDLGFISAAKAPDSYTLGVPCVWLASPPEPDAVVPDFRAAVGRLLQTDAAYADKHHGEKPKEHLPRALFRHIEGNWYLGLE